MRDYPLKGITVIDLGQVYQGPYAGFLLAKAGATVIKVEPPGGEPLRAREEVSGRALLPMAMLNQHKRAISLNLKSEKGKELLIKLAKKGDVLIENYAPGVMDKLGVGADVLMSANPRLIYASATGYGLSGPERDSLAMDITVQAASGVMSVTGFPDSPPVKAGPAIADFISGTHLYAGIVTALFERERTGQGRHVEISMQETLYPTFASNLGLMTQGHDGAPPRVGNRHGGLALAPYNVYPSKDGYVSIICIKESHWQNLLKAMGREDLKEDERFVNNARRVRHIDETDALVSQWTSAHTRDDLFELTREHRVPSAPVRDLVEVTHNEHMHERGMLHWLDHSSLGRIVVPDSPIRFGDTPPMGAAENPKLGEHNAEVLRELLGLSENEISELMEEGIL